MRKPPFVLSRALFVVLYIFNNIADVTVQNKAKRIQSFHGDILTMLHPMQNICGNAMLEDQLIFRYVLFA